MNQATTILTCSADSLGESERSTEADFGLRDGLSRDDHDAFEVAFNASPDALALVLSEPGYDARAWRVNRAFCELTGYAKTEILGRSLADLGLWYDDGLRRSVIAHLQAGAVINDLEALLRRKDGTLIPTAFSAQRVTIGGRAAFLAIRRDIRVRAESLRKLRESEERWRFALESDGGALWEWDLERQVVFRSQRVLSMLGTPDAANECPENEGLAQLTRTDAEAVRSDCMRLLKAEIEDVRGECDLLMAEGGTIRICYSARVMSRDPFGKVRRIVGTVRDITQQRQHTIARRSEREKLAHHSRLILLGEMATITAHEINQPLAAIANYAGLLINQLTDWPDQRDLAGRIEHLALRAGEISWRIRGFAARGATYREPLSIVDVFSDIVRWFESDEWRDVSIRTFVESNLPRVFADRIQIEQIMLNLMRNAIQAMECLPGGKELELHADLVANDQIRVRVADRGRGVPDKIAMDAFKPFFTTRKNGLGLGLSICHSLVTAHGGKLWCDARPGGGTVFSFTLPKAREDQIGNATESWNESA